MPELESLPEEVQARLEAQRITDDAALSTYLNLSQSAVEAAERFRTDFDVAWGDAARVVAALHKSGGVEEASSERLAALEAEIRSLKCHPVFDLTYHIMQYGSTTSSQGRGTKAFKIRLIQSYVDPSCEDYPDTLPCNMTGEFLPSAFVIAAHLFKSEWAKMKAHTILLDFEDIDDARNGLLLFKPIEWAFDRAQLMFVEVETDAQGLPMFEMRLLDRELVDVKLIEQLLIIDKGYQSHKSFSDVEAAIGELTFGDLDKKLLQFRTQCRPFKRVLNFHAKMNAARAIRLGWYKKEDAVVQFSDFASPFKGAKLVQEWLDQHEWLDTRALPQPHSSVEISGVE